MTDLATEAQMVAGALGGKFVRPRSKGMQGYIRIERGEGPGWRHTILDDDPLIAAVAALIADRDRWRDLALRRGTGPSGCMGAMPAVDVVVGSFRSESGWAVEGTASVPVRECADEREWLAEGVARAEKVFG